jgi:hypothetical protein
VFYTCHIFIPQWKIKMHLLSERQKDRQFFKLYNNNANVKYFVRYIGRKKHDNSRKSCFHLCTG